MIFRGLNFSRNADIGQIGHFWMDTNYAQSTISTQIRLLEEEFGKPRFDRLGKTIVLTEAGEVLLRYAGKMLDIQIETFDQVSGWEESHGSITLRAPQSLSAYALPPLLTHFKQEIETAILMIRHKDKWVPPSLQVFMEHVPGDADTCLF